jgi:hypothetical protein
MTKVIFVGEMYYSDLSIGGGPIIPPAAPGYPSHPWVPPPPYPDQGLPPVSPGYPSHPWVPPSAGAPGYPSHPWVPPQPGVPTHPIAPGGRPPGIWGGPPLYPDQGLPGPQPIPTPPIYLPPGTIPGHPEHPIYIPPSIWPSPGVPTHPIVLPPAGSGEKPEVLENWNATTIWTPESGWVVAIVPSEEHPGAPTPSEAT